MVRFLEFCLLTTYGTFRIGNWHLRGRLLDVQPSLGLCWSATERNIDRFRGRWLRARPFPLSDTMGPITLDDGSVLQVPLHAGALPVEHHFPPPLFRPVVR